MLLRPSAASGLLAQVIASAHEDSVVPPGGVQTPRRLCLLGAPIAASTGADRTAHNARVVPPGGVQTLDRNVVAQVIASSHEGCVVPPGAVETPRRLRLWRSDNCSLKSGIGAAHRVSLRVCVVPPGAVLTPRRLRLRRSSNCGLKCRIGAAHRASLRLLEDRGFAYG